jgi:hypothetical protein
MLLDIGLEFKMAIEYNAHIVQDGLVLCLDAASKASYPGTGTLWNDLAGSSNGTLINDATFSGANEGVIVFDGTDDYVDCGDSTSLEFSSGESFTLSVWFKGTSARGALLGKGYDTGSQDRPWYLLWCNNSSSGHVNLYLRSVGGGSFYTSNSTKINDNEWHNIVGVYDASAATITTYTDAVAGTPVGSVSAQAYGTNSSPFVVGKHNNEEINGSVGLVHVYNKALSAAEILQNYNVAIRRYT